MICAHSMHTSNQDCVLERPLNGIDIHGWQNGPEGIVVFARLRDSQLNIHVESRAFHRSPNALKELQQNQARFGSDHFESELYDYLETIISFFASSFGRLVPHSHHVGKLTLAHLGLRHRYCSRLEFHDEVPRAGSIIEDEYDEEDECCEYSPPRQLGDSSDYGHAEETSPTWPFPHFKLSEVEVPCDEPDNVFTTVPDRVFINGRQLFWKPSWSCEEVSQVVDKYHAIHQSRIPVADLRTPRLYGIVVGDRNELCGQLYDWISIDQYITWDVVEKTPMAVREKWISQIRKTVSCMHSIGVVWGDVKADNVVIDGNGDVVVIDLEGGATNGWVDKDVMNTKLGDLQGLEKLTNYILDDESTLRARDKELDLNDSLERRSLMEDCE